MLSLWFYFVVRAPLQRILHRHLKKFGSTFLPDVFSFHVQEEENCLLDPNSDRMKMLAEEFKNNKQELILVRSFIFCTFFTLLFCFFFTNPQNNSVVL